MDSEKSSGTVRTPAQTDRELWLAIMQGQTEALGLLYDRHASLVYGIALKVLGTPQEAEDLTQDIFVKLSQSSFKPEKGSLRTFLAILARSRAVDRVRSRQREAKRAMQQLTPELLSSASDTLETASQCEQAQSVQQALSQLSGQEQQLLRMAYYDGLTQASISKDLAMPLGTVKSKVRRGLIKLRQILQEQAD